MKAIVSLFFFGVLATATFGQDGNYDHFLARQFAENGEFAKAAEYYADLFSQADGLTYYEEYLEVLKKLEDGAAAEALIKLAYKRSGENPIYLIDLGDLYTSMQRNEDAAKQYAKVIKELKPEKYQINLIATRFANRRQLDQAMQVYERGRQLLKNPQAFNLEMANLYLLKNDFNSMMLAYLDEAPMLAGNLAPIENGLQKGLKDEEAKDVLEKELLKRTQQQKGIYVYQDLLVWLYMQRNDFDGAILQAKSLDLLRAESGENVLRIARTAAEQQDYNAAIKGFQYVVNKGKNYPYFIIANLELINVQRDKLIQSPVYTAEQLLSVRTTYKQFIGQYSSSDIALDATIELAQLEALYIHEVDTAIALLLPIVENNRLKKETAARAKLNLGDYYIIQDNPWDAQLLYTQVEKDFKGSPLGEEAKFRNARLSYYKGDFEWAQTQLKIIKANTSELISNDAIDLSVFVLDNLNTDTTDYALLKYAKADLLRFQNKLDEAEDTLNDILKNYLGSSLADDVYYMKYKIERQRQHYEKAAEYLLKIEQYFGEDILGDNAVFYLGELYQRYLGDEEKAKACYERIITEFKDSTFAIEARKRYRKLRGDS